MTWRTWVWGGPFLAWLLVLGLPLLVILIPINLDDDASSNERIVGNILLIASFLLILVMHNWITVASGKVRFGFFPLYWKSLQVNEIRYVIRVDFNPMRDFAGWGIKGMAKSRNGILLGGNPSRGVMIETHDRRRYVLSFTDPDAVLQALQREGCTLAAGIEDVISEKV